MAKETYLSGKRGPTYQAKEDLLIRQKRPIAMSIPVVLARRYYRMCSLTIECVLLL